RRSRQEAIDLGEVTKGRSSQSILTVNRPGNLAGVERNRHLVRHWQVERLSQIVVVAFLRIERSKEPQLVMDDRTANVAADVYFRKTIGRRSREREVVDSTNQTFGGAISKYITVELVTTALGDDVENAAR